MSEQRLVWKRRRHEASWYRRLARSGYLLGYIGSALFAGLPIIARSWYDPQSKVPISLLILLLAWTAMVGIPVAVLCMRRFFMFKEAIAVIANQQQREPQAPSARLVDKQVIQLGASNRGTKRSQSPER